MGLLVELLVVAIELGMIVRLLLLLLLLAVHVGILHHVLLLLLLLRGSRLRILALHDELEHLELVLLHGAHLLHLLLMGAFCLLEHAAVIVRSDRLDFHHALGLSCFRLL